ncbi:MAG: ABC transporter ATP-binding protein [Gemmatimonadota bacterium]|nr:MAG: ABC transporter ATP-binding protein [Gemmatimonadota bacterium]
MAPLVRVENVAFRYASRQGRALDGISFELKPGQVFGLVGPNGSGKTTLYRLLLGLLRPLHGAVQIGGLPPAAYRRRWGIGYLPEQVRLPGRVRVREFAVFVARLAGLGSVEARLSTATLAGKLMLEDVLHCRVGTLSHGYRQRVGLLAALIGDPRLLLLDEPANGLDPVSIGVLRAAVRALKREGKSVVVSSHNLVELERLCDEVLIVTEGKLLGRASREDLASRPDIWVVQLQAGLSCSEGDGHALADRWGGVCLAVDEVAFQTEDGARAFGAEIAKIGSQVERIERRGFDLECLFHFLVRPRGRS